MSHRAWVKKRVFFPVGVLSEMLRSIPYPTSGSTGFTQGSEASRRAGWSMPGGKLMKVGKLFWMGKLPKSVSWAKFFCSFWIDFEGEGPTQKPRNHLILERCHGQGEIPAIKTDLYIQKFLFISTWTWNKNHETTVEPRFFFGNDTGRLSSPCFWVPRYDPTKSLAQLGGRSPHRNQRQAAGFKVHNWGVGAWSRGGQSVVDISKHFPYHTWIPIGSMYGIYIYT